MGLLEPAPTQDSAVASDSSTSGSRFPCLLSLSEGLFSYQLPAMSLVSLVEASFLCQFRLLKSCLRSV